ncbi:uncharacterized protein BDR25DRAFT_265671 [Lindgomyces ingoldianus]|uniref:Uncharacterized protein n=1 Tax=Lindgomyces ingoldianus TaxID=673940 RepID=A0ACB6QMG8_9PLEO|nr:uncharacterized protein BDR25DRAFT_265671 [Lindgomyces ingoldianus]KAF2468090.1 hypothetical protein BDR25DRAFT_265671 [Lindgomyces ingoldianus]
MLTMANLSRPPLRSSTERRGRQGKSPATTDENSTHTQHNNTAVSTRRSSRGAPLVALNDEPAPAAIVTPAATLGKAVPAPLARANSRKRPTAALSADATTTIADTRPPTKVTVTQPHGKLLQVTNGVPTKLGIGEDEHPSGVSTPKAANGIGAAVVVAGLTVPVQSAATQTTQTQDKRSLRSQDGGSRLKSDLSIYFSNYDDIIADVPQPPEFLDLETPIYVVDEPLKTTKPSELATSTPSRPSASPNRSRKSRARTPQNVVYPAPLHSSQASTTFQVLDYSTIARHLRSDNEEDPLADPVYLIQHRRAERKEKQLRNIEKERAMHEKVQLERLLDGLQGPDWLKVMGITGVTDGERKDWEPKRDYFVKEVEALVDKFRIWKEEEKRLRAEKEAALAAREEGEDDDDEDEDEDSDVVSPNGVDSTRISEQHQREKEAPPPKPRRPPRPQGFLLLLPPEPTTPFTSFYAKPHLRATALGKHRHGRNASAFGQPIPEFEEHEFEPPEEYLTPEALRDHARKRRRQKRESGVQKT